MKKIYVLIFLVISSLHVCWCAYSKSYHKQTYRADNGSAKKKKKISCSEHLVQAMRQFVESNNASSLDDFLKKIDVNTKKALFIKQLPVVSTKGESFTVDVLILAVCYRFCDIVRVLVKHGADCNQSSFEGFNPLSLAVDSNNTSMIETLLQCGADINRVCADGFNSMTRAVNKSLPSTVELLIKYKPLLNVNDGNGNSPLYIASRERRVELIPVLVRNGADINMTCNNGFTPLTVAVDNGDSAMVETLIAHGADSNKAGHDGFSPLNRAVADNAKTIVETLIRLGADVNYADANKNTPLYMAAGKGFTELIPMIVKGGARINMQTPSGFTPLSIAVDKNNISTVELLVTLGADLNLSMGDGFSPLNRAIADGLRQMVLTLIRLGVDINRADENGNIPLLFAFTKGHKEIIEDLIANNADINVQDADGNTPLHKAIEKSYDTIVSELIKRGADITIKNSNNITPSLLAEVHDNTALAETLFKKREPSVGDLRKALDANNVELFFTLLKQFKKDPLSDHQNVVDITYDALILGNKRVFDLCCAKENKFLTCCIAGHAPVHYAAIYGHDALMRYLIEDCHIDVNEPDLYGLTPVHYAVIYRNYDMLKYLIKKNANINQMSQEDLGVYKSDSTPYDLAVQLGYADIADLLSSCGARSYKAYTNSVMADRMSKLAIFIDRNNEYAQTKQQLVSVKSALSKELCSLIQQKTCPVLIIGAHMLRNVVQLSDSLKDWLIVEITWNGIGGYLLIPKRVIMNTESDIGPLESLLASLGFAVSSINYTCVDDTYVRNKQFDENTLLPKNYSSLVPDLIDALLLPKDRVVYWSGHGSSASTKYIGNLMGTDASQLLQILSRKNTKLVWISTCFLGGKNLEYISNFSDMTVVSSATTEIILYQSHGATPVNWGGFFNGLAAYTCFMQHDKGDSYLSTEVLPHLVNQSLHISNFPHIKHAGNSYFTLLPNEHAFLLNPEIMACYGAQGVSCVVEKKKLLELVDIEQILQPVVITQKVPLIISNKYRNIFKKVCIDTLPDTDKLDFIAVMRKLTRASIFVSSTIENVFIIQELYLFKKLFLDIKNNTQKLMPKAFYNVVIKRGPSSKCCVFLSTVNGALSKVNALCIAYDNKASKWTWHQDLSQDELATYQRLLSQK